MHKDLLKWASYEALEECIRRDSAPVARAVNLSLKLVQKWKEQPATDEDYTQSGTRNPLDRIEHIINTIEKIAPKRAYIPIYWLCARFGFANPVKLPQIHSSRNINRSLLEWTREFGETCQAVSKALEDGRVSGAEFRKIHRELMEDMAAGMALLEAVKQSAQQKG